MSTSEDKQYWEVETQQDYDYYQADRMDADGEHGTLIVQRLIPTGSERPSTNWMGHEVIAYYPRGAWVMFRQISKDHFDKQDNEGYV